MPAQTGDKRTQTCQGMTKAGAACTSYVRDGERFCHWHRDQAKPAEVVNISQAVKRGADHLSSREERMQWLDDVWQGRVQDEQMSPRGDLVKKPASIKDRREALAQLERMERGTDEDDSALDAIADRVRERLGLG